MKLEDEVVQKNLRQNDTIEVVYDDGSRNFYRMRGGHVEVHANSQAGWIKGWSSSFADYRVCSRPEQLLLENDEVEFELYDLVATPTPHPHGWRNTGATYLTLQPLRVRFRYRGRKFEKLQADGVSWAEAPVVLNYRVAAYKVFNKPKVEITCVGLEKVVEQCREIESLARKAADKMKPEEVDYKALYRALGEGKDVEVKFGDEGFWLPYRIGGHGRPQFKNAAGQWYMHDGLQEVTAWREKREPIKVEVRSVMAVTNAAGAAVACVHLPDGSGGRRFNIVATEVVDE